MVYDDEKTREEEAKFQEQLMAAREFAQKDLPVIAAAVREMMDQVTAIMENPDRTPEDLEMLDHVEKVLEESLALMRFAKNIIGQNLLRMSTAIYEGYRIEADNGNEKARELYEKLRPSYQAMLQQQLDNNLQ